MTVIFLMKTLNVLSAVLIFIHAVCRLTHRAFSTKQVELWAYAVIVGASVLLISYSITNQPPPGEVMLSSGLAALFTIRSYRMWRAGVLHLKQGCRHDI